MQKHMGCGLLIALITSMAVMPNREAQSETKRSVTVVDTIRMTTIPETKYAAEDASKSRIALFSPDEKQFVLVTERGIPESNEREFSLLLFEAGELFSPPKNQVLLTMRSR